MRHCFPLFAIICLSFPALCQTAARQSTTVPRKSVIDSTAIADWYDLRGNNATVSANGRYFMYPIRNLPAGKQTLVVQSTRGAWKREFIGVNGGAFSFDSKYVIFQSTDTLFFFALGSDKKEYVTDVSSYAYPKIQSKGGSYNTGKLITYKLKRANVLVLRDMVSNEQLKIDNVSDYFFNKDVSAILIRRTNKELAAETLEWMNIASKVVKQVWSNIKNGNSSVSSYAFDESGNRLAFLTQDKGAENNTLWYYEPGMPQAEIKVSNEILNRKDGMCISSSAPSFSKNGKFIFFTLQRGRSEVSPTPDPRAVQVDVWTHKDLVLQPLEAFFKNRNQEIPQSYIKTQFLASIAIESNQVRQLENDTSVVVSQNFNSDFVITSPYVNTGDKAWFEYRNRDYYLTSLRDGRRKYLMSGVKVNFSLSPDEQFLVYFDSHKGHYMSYCPESGSTKNITRAITVPLTLDEGDEYLERNSIPAGIACWLDNGNLIIRDNYDLWMLDPCGKNAARNITNGYGRANSIKFDLIVDVNEGQANANAILPSNKPLSLSGFWKYTKQNGFYKTEINKEKDPQLLALLDCLIYYSGSRPIKAIDADIWIVKKQTLTNAPNFYVTSDFKSFKQLTDIQPQKKYRWLTNELITWKTPDGKICQGILYKPEDFDSTKKYPVIFYYYEQFSDGLHEFLRPALSNGALDVPWFVSRGYLVFVPDIHYKVGSVAKSVVNSVVTGAHTILKLPYIDSTAMGLQGLSFGGYETNILITESNLFSAAVEGAGPSNLISQYGSLLPTERGNGQGAYHQEQGGQLRMKGLLWGNQGDYIENSPIFKANKVTTPLLIMHNKGDQAVPWGQAVELFIALRRLEKLVWMLQYDQGGHGVENVKDKMDFTTRMTQFFDHYLKGAPAPKWMTNGVPAKLKGMDAGLGLDMKDKCGDNCKVCEMWNEKLKKDSDAALKEIDVKTKAEFWIGGDK